MGYGTFRLPTEAEWEYACRAGTTERFYWGNSDSEDLMKQYCWYDGNACDEHWTSPHAEKEGTQPVGSKLPNDFGLFDMSGNVWEWSQDLYGNYPTNAVVDPTGPQGGSNRTLRGGSWYHEPRYVRSAQRLPNDPRASYITVGFRLVLECP